MKKASTDNKNYKLKKVANEINLLEVIDSGSQYFAIAVLIKTGSFNDPPDCPGLAHLFEHCLFTGSENFPKDNHLTHYLDKHHGQVNAWTSTEQTVFYMKVPLTAADEALKMFLDMLLHPLFSLEGINKEINTINSEFYNKLSEEQRRIQDVQKETCNPAHPFSRFSVGNKAAFEKFSATELQQKLKEWHQTWIMPSQLQLCCYQAAESQTTEQLLSSAFKSRSGITEPVAQKTLPPLYSDNELQKVIFITSKKPHQRLLLTFALKHDKLHFDEKYDALISHLIGYEGQDSLLDFLKKQKWATQLISGIGLTGSNFTDFNINIELTGSGMENLESVIQCVFLFNSLLAESDLAWRYQEKARLNQLAFTYNAPENPLDCVLRLVRNMEAYPEQEVLSGEYLMSYFDARKFNCVLADIHPENMRALVIAADVPTNRVSHWYQVPYSIHSIAIKQPGQELQSLFQNQVSLPGPNPYIPTPVEACKLISQTPEQRQINNHLFWFGQDNVNSDAQGECFFSWRADQIKPDIQHVANKKLFSSTLEARLNDRFYAAQVAGLHYRVYAHQSGIGLHTSGFADKQLKLCQELLPEVLTPPSPCDNFELHKQEYLNSLQSSISHKPLNRLFTVLQTIFVQASWLPEDLAKHVYSCQFEDVVAAQSRIFANYQCESLIFGNFTPGEMENFVDHNPFQPYHGTGKTQSSLVLLHEINERSLNFPCEHRDSAYVFYLQSQHKSLPEQAKMMLVESLLAGFYFNWMRNEKQVGYQVGTGYMPFNEHPGTALYVQSTSNSAVEIDIETQQCLKEFCQWLAVISPAQWDRCKQNIIRQLAQTNVSFSVACQRLWTAIGRGDSSFQTEKRLQKTVVSLTLEEVVTWFYELVFDLKNHFTVYSSGAKGPDSTDSDAFHFTNALSDFYQFKD